MYDVSLTLSTVIIDVIMLLNLPPPLPETKLEQCYAVLSGHGRSTLKVPRNSKVLYAILRQRIKNTMTASPHRGRIHGEEKPSIRPLVSYCATYVCVLDLTMRSSSANLTNHLVQKSIPIPVADNRRKADCKNGTSGSCHSRCGDGEGPSSLFLFGMNVLLLS